MQRCVAQLLYPTILLQIGAYILSCEAKTRSYQEKRSLNGNQLASVINIGIQAKSLQNKDTILISDVSNYPWNYGFFAIKNGQLLYEATGMDSLAEHKMDLWNNSIGRKYGKKTKSRTKLALLLKIVLKNNELIINLEDSRPYTGLFQYQINDKKPVIAIQKNKSGRNEIFYDLIKKIIFTKDEFINFIQQGQYPGYKIIKRKTGLTPMSIQDKTIDNNLG